QAQEALPRADPVLAGQRHPDELAQREAGMRTADAPVTEVRGGRRSAGRDQLAVEAPLEIRVRAGDSEQNVSITMRTPGEGDERALGFLFTEGLLRASAEVAGVSLAGDEVAVVELAAGVSLPESRPTRAFAMTSACGVCGRGSLEGLRATPAGPLEAG